MSDKQDTWESMIDVDTVKLIRTKTNVWFGCGAIEKMNDICEEMKQRGWKKCLVVTGKSSYEKCGAWEPVKKAFETHEIQYKLFNKILPNPLVEHVNEAVKLGLDFGVDFIVAIGGGSPIDSAKAIATLLKYPNNDCYDLYKGKKNFPDPKFIQALPVIAINTTHGTGTEADRYSVISFPEKLEKLGSGHENVYPMYSIDDPNLLKSLPLKQTIYTAVDALNHANECATSKIRSPYSILLAKETIRLVLKYLPIVIKNPEDKEGRYYLHYASMIAGTGIDNSGCHITHQLEHVLSSVQHSLAHGLGLAMLLPAVEREIYPKSWRILVDIFSPILPEKKEWGKDLEKEREEFSKIIEEWVFSVGDRKSVV